ncbi:MAG: DUF6142 family protein [Lachnospiraceae bacterium]|jgi:hypothetical protein|nr:DUF6142 family protein [Lachnospiraceae bacterium]
MVKKSYIFTNKKNPLTGIMAVILGVIANGVMLLLVYFSFAQSGEISVRFGELMTMAAIFAFVGLALAAVGLIKKEKYRLFPLIGMVMNTIALAWTAVMIFLGS